MRLVLVHGIAQQGKDPSELKRAWLEALDVGLANAGLGSIKQHEVILPFYGDTLAQLTAQIEAPDSIELQTKGVAAAPEFDRIEVELLQEILSTQLRNADERDGVTTKGIQNSVAALAIARAADSTPFGAPFLSRFVKDVAAYLNHRRVMQKVHEIVQPAINTERCVVVGHSLGSVVAFRILREMGRSANVERFITLGSPLGLNTIRTLITPPPLETPIGVKSWTNAFDPTDVVSLHPLDRTTWDVKPAIVNISDVNNQTPNRHGIGGYLDDGRVAAAIYEALSK